MKPILFGSSSYRSDGEDIDVIDDVDDYLIKKIDGEKRYDIQPILPGSSNEDLYRFFNNSKFVKTVTMGYGELIILPEIANYILLKSHIHRILPKTRNHATNISLWERHMRDYTQLRERFDYQFLDSLLYDDRDSFYSKLFFKRFAESNIRYGDTKQTFNKDGFFNDNVPRLIPHDILHEHVAKMFRNTTELLFKKFLVEPDAVEMSEELFLKATRDEQIQVLVEEIAVLLIERQLAPTIMKTKQKMGRDELSLALADARSHFICNLCGSGHYWLRNFCLNHWKQLEGNSLYRLEDLEQLTIDLLKVNVKEFKPIYTFEQIYASFLQIYRFGRFGDDDEVNNEGIDFSGQITLHGLGKETSIENCSLFNCKDRKFYKPSDKVVLVSPIKFPGKLLAHSSVIIDNIENPQKYLIIIGSDQAIFCDGKDQFLLFIDFYELSQGHGEISGLMERIKPLDKEEVEEFKKTADIPDRRQLEKILNSFSCALFNSNISCGYGEVDNYVLNRRSSNRDMMELFEIYFITQSEYNKTIDEANLYLLERETLYL